METALIATLLGANLTALRDSPSHAGVSMDENEPLGRTSAPPCLGVTFGFHIQQMIEPRSLV